MGKRSRAFDATQMTMDFGSVPGLPSDGMLSGIDRKVSSSVSQILKDDDRDRYDVAAAMSRLMDAEISKSMLDKYSSETSDEHNISVGRWWALIGATGRFDILRHFVRKLGCDLVVGEEVLTVELGHIQAQMEKLQERQRQLKKIAPALRPAKRGGASR